MIFPNRIRKFAAKLLITIVLSIVLAGLFEFVKSESVYGRFWSVTNTETSALAFSQPPKPPKRPKLPPPVTVSNLPLGPLCKGENLEDENIIALLPPNETDILTISENPTLLFYVPFQSKRGDEKSDGEFSVARMPGENLEVDRTEFKLPQTPGIVSIQIMPFSGKILEEGVKYRWYFKIYCEDSSGSKASQTVTSYVERVKETSERKLAIDRGNLLTWYETFSNLYSNLTSSTTQSTSIKDEWKKILDNIGQSKLAQKKLASPVTRLPKPSNSLSESPLIKN